MKRICIVLLCAGAGLVPACKAQPNAGAPAHAAPPAGAERGTAPAAGYFYGSTGEAWCRCGWLLRLDGRGGGALYSPPGAVPVHARTREDGSVVIESEGEVPFRFVGVFGAAGFTGTVAPVHPSRFFPGAESGTRVSLRRIPDALAQAAASPAGFYTNSRYHAESGDRAGLDVVVVPLAGDSLAFVTTEYPGLLPAPSGVVRRAGAGEISLGGGDAPAGYHPVFRDRALVLEPGRGAARGSGEVLRRVGTLADLLRVTPRGTAAGADARD